MTEINVNTVGGNGDFETVISESSQDIQAIARALRELIASVMPDVTEVPWGKQKIAGYGIGPKKNSEQFCYIAPFKKHVNLGFYYGVDLDDPENLLEGSGKKLRHIRIRSLDEVHTPAVHDLIEQASKHLPKLK